MIESTVTCDGCKQTIDTKTDYASEAYLELSRTWKTHRGIFSYPESEPSDISRTMHFHNLDCVRVFLEDS